MTEKLNAYDYWHFPANFRPISFVSEDFCYLDYLVRSEFVKKISQIDETYCSISCSIDELAYLPLLGICIGQCSSNLVKLYPVCACKNIQQPPWIHNFQRVIAPRAYPPLKSYPNESPMVLKYYFNILVDFKNRLQADRDFNTLMEELPRHEIVNPNSLFYFRHKIEYFANCWRYFLRKRYLQLTRNTVLSETVGR